MLNIVEASFSLKYETLNQHKEIDRNAFNSSSTIKTIFLTMILYKKYDIGQHTTL